MPAVFTGASNLPPKVGLSVTNSNIGLLNAGYPIWEPKVRGFPTLGILEYATFPNLGNPNVEQFPTLGI